MLFKCVLVQMIKHFRVKFVHENQASNKIQYLPFPKPKDDQGIWAAGCYGNPEIRTPNIDRLAATGVRFENFFITIPVCSASRACFLTGRIPSQHGVHDFLTGRADMGPDAKSFMDDEICYTDILAEPVVIMASGERAMARTPSTCMKTRSGCLLSLPSRRSFQRHGAVSDDRVL